MLFRSLFFKLLGVLGGITGIASFFWGILRLGRYVERLVSTGSSLKIELADLKGEIKGLNVSIASTNLELSSVREKVIRVETIIETKILPELGITGVKVA